MTLTDSSPKKFTLLNGRVVLIALLSALALLAFTGASPCAAAQPKSKAPKEKALTEAEKRKQAGVLMRDALARFLKNGNSAEAQKGLKAAIAKDPTFAEPYFNLGLIAEASEEWKEAILWYGKAETTGRGAELGKESARKLASLQGLIEQDRTPEGKRRRQYDDKIDRARFLARNGFMKEAAVIAGSARDLDDSRWEAYAVVASALAGQGLSQDAIPFIQQSIEKAPVQKKPGLTKILAQLASYRVVPPRPEFPFELSPAVWEVIENSEYYRNLPRSPSARIDSKYELKIEYVGSKSKSLRSPPTKEYTEKRVLTPLGDKGASFLIGNTNSYFFGGFLNLGATTGGKVTNTLDSIEELTGSLFPMRVGAKQSIRYNFSCLPNRRFDMKMSSVCRVEDRGEAKELNPRLSGAAWRIRCQGANKIDGKTNSSEYDEYYIEDLGVLLSFLGQLNNLSPLKMIIPTPGTTMVTEAKGEYGSRITKVYSSYDWKVGE